MFPLNVKQCRIAKICLVNSQLKFTKSLAALGNFFQLVEIFTILPSKFLMNCLMHGKTVKRNCFNVSRKHCPAVMQRQVAMT